MRRLLLAAALAVGCGGSAPGVEKGEGWIEIDCADRGVRSLSGGGAYYFVYSPPVSFDEPEAPDLVAQMCDITRVECDGRVVTEECTSLQGVHVSFGGQISTVCEYGQVAPVGSAECRGTKSRTAGYVRVTWQPSD